MTWKNAERLLLAIVIALFCAGGYMGLVVAPPEAFMGDVYRIIYVHVPSALCCLLAYTVCFVACMAYLLRSSPKADAIAESAAEVGVVLNVLLLMSGSLWGRPTWGIWWTWDPRLTTAAIMLFAYGAYTALRHFVDDSDKRAAWAAVTGIVIYADIPIVYFSVKWWNTLHQMQSSPSTVDPAMVAALRINLLAFVCVLLWFLRQRYCIARMRQVAEQSEPPAPILAQEA